MSIHFDLSLNIQALILLVQIALEWWRRSRSTHTACAENKLRTSFRNVPAPSSTLDAGNSGYLSQE